MPKDEVSLAAGLAAALVILTWSTQYGVFRDEVYYWVCARHLDWGYVDHPPLSIAMLRLVGERLWILKVPAALAFGLSVFLTARQAGGMGAGLWGESVAALATGLCPVLVAIAGLYSMNVLEIGFWSISATISAKILVDATPARWMALGCVAGLGLLNKYSMLMFPVGLGAGMLLTPARRQLLTPSPWVAGLTAVIFSPHIAWEVRHGAPSLEFMRNATEMASAVATR